MSAVLLKHSTIVLATCSVFLTCFLPLQAESKHHYPETGKVISATTDHGDVYKIETDARIYEMKCISAAVFQSAPPVCEVSGKPIAVKDTVHFRLEEDDTAYIPAIGNKEEKLLVLSTEVKVLPPLVPVTNPLDGESCAVLGRGQDLIQSHYTVSNSSPVTPTGPVLAIPVTGGPPVQVIASGPANGGVVTGVPVTGGSPVTAIPVAPVMGTSGGGTSTVTDSEWVHFLRLQTARHVYKIACPSRDCWLKDRAPRLGDLLTIRIKGKTAYLSWGPSGPKGEQKFAIISVDNMN